MALTVSVLALTSETSGLERTLESIRPAADEILILSGEADAVSGIAESFGARVMAVPSDRPMAEYVCEQASEPWVLFVHSGEQLAEESVDELRSVTGKNPHPGPLPEGEGDKHVGGLPEGDKHVGGLAGEGASALSPPPLSPPPLSPLFVHVRYPGFVLYRPRLLRADSPQDESFALEPLPRIAPDEFTRIHILKNQASAETERPLDELTLFQLREDAQNPKAHLARAIYYRLVQNDGDAEFHFEETLRLSDPEVPDHQPYRLFAACQLSAYRLRSNDPVAAEEHCASCLSVDDLYLDAWLRVGEAYFLQDKFWMAEKAFRRYRILCRQSEETRPVALTAQHPSARCPLQETGQQGHACFLLGRLSEFRFDFLQACRHYEEAVALGHRTWSLYAYLINVLSYLKEPEKVGELLQEARKLFPDFDERIKEFSNDMPMTDRSPLGGSAGLTESQPEEPEDEEEREEQGGEQGEDKRPESIIEYRPKFSFLNVAEMDAIERDVLMAVSGLFEGCERVLDVGCGAGTFLRRLRDRGLVGFGIEEDPKLAEVCRYRGLEAEATTMAALIERGESFDGIHLGHAIERHHQAEVGALLEHCLHLLKPGGLLVIRTANTKNSKVAEKFWMNYQHVSHYSLEQAMELVAQAGLEIVYAVQELSGVQDNVVVGRNLKPQISNSKSQTPNLKLQIHWSGHFFGSTGRSTINRKLCSELLSLVDAEISIQAEDTSYEFSQHPGFFPELFARMEARGEAERGGRSITPSLHHSIIRFLPSPHTPTPPHVLHSSWDYPTLPASWQTHAKDETVRFWVASDHIRCGFVQDGVHEERITVIPPGVDMGVFHPASDPWLEVNQYTKVSFKFLFIGSTQPRHGLSRLVEAFVREFNRSDDVCLVIKEVERPGEARDEECIARVRAALQSPEAPEVIHMRIALSDVGLAGLYTASNAFVYPCLATDFPLPALEAMACACPVIVPQAGACLELSPASRVADDLVYWIETEGESSATVDIETVRSAQNILPSIESIQQQMRYVLENRDEARARAQLASEYVSRNFTWKQTAEKGRGMVEGSLLNG